MLSLLPARSHTHSVSFFDIQESNDSNLTSYLGRMTTWYCWGIDRATVYEGENVSEIAQFPLLAYLSSFLYRLSNPVVLMVIWRTVRFDIWFRWCQLTSWFPLWPKKNRFKVTQALINIESPRCHKQRRQYREQRKLRHCSKIQVISTTVCHRQSTQVGKDHIMQKYNRSYPYECVSSKRIQRCFESELTERR